MAPPITGILETAIYVDDIKRAAAFYRDILGLKAMIADDRLVAFDAGPASVLLLFRRGATLQDVHLPGGTIPAHDSSGPYHFALRIPKGQLDAWRDHLVAKGVVITAEMRWPQGGESLYFNDPDGHVVELATPGIWSNDLDLPASALQNGI
ncbi:lactoylglutathione lyase [Kaistia sp. 32K]|uniref:VOC family protein n=1 Tax=Kaistia sp. 32K TaxID=2795690 RepID=UPI00191562E3|nr:VOC family protein [Kaistia sp. 32K]BCP53091.1 lactoylglutathione lyase [Kaistia sp. 32K]